MNGISFAPFYYRRMVWAKIWGMHMKRHRSHASFIENLRQKIRSLRKMKPEDIHVFTIDASYGRYQIVIGPLEKNHRRSLEIDGNIHHLFISPKAISPNPSKNQIRTNLKNTIIMRDLSVHLFDPLDAEAAQLPIYLLATPATKLIALLVGGLPHFHSKASEQIQASEIET